MKQYCILFLVLFCSLLIAEPGPSQELVNDDATRQSCPFTGGALFCNAAFNNLCVSGSVDIGGDLTVDGVTTLNDVIISGPVDITNSTQSTNCTNGAFTVSG